MPVGGTEETVLPVRSNCSVIKPSNARSLSKRGTDCRQRTVTARGSSETVTVRNTRLSATMLVRLLVNITLLVISCCGTSVAQHPLAFIGGCKPLRLRSTVSFLIPSSNERNQQKRHVLISEDEKTITLSSSTFNMMDKSEEQDDAFETAPESFKPLDTTTELWLDLRGTQIAPRAALLYLEENNSGNDFFASPLQQDGTTRPTRSIVNRVLVSTNGIQRALQLSNTNDSGGDKTPEAWVVGGDDDGNLIRSVGDNTVLHGKAISIQGEFADPIPALDVINKGGWVIIDTNKQHIDESNRLGAISSLVNFVSSGISSGGSFLLGGSKDSTLDLTNEGDDNNDSVPYYDNGNAGDKGGVAVSCESRDDVVKIGALFKTIQSSRGVVTTDSGILLQQTAFAESSDPDDTLRSEASLQTAVVLPFDGELWTLAAFVFGEFDPC